MKISEDFSHIVDFEFSTQITISMSFRLCKLQLALATNQQEEIVIIEKRVTNDDISTAEARLHADAE